MAKQDNSGVSAVITAVLVGMGIGAVIGVIASLIFDNWYFAGVFVISGTIVAFIMSFTNREFTDKK